MNVFIDISSDRIGIYGLDNPIFLDRNWVEIEIWKILVELDRKHGFNECIILNWPGWFTNLRVWTLSLNLLKTLKNDQIKFYSISKPELYSIFYKNGWIPRYWILYIWQKSNVWVRDTEKNELIKMIKKSDINKIKDEYWETYLDQVYDETYFWGLENKLHYTYEDWNLILTFNLQYTLNWKVLINNEVEKLDANYMIAPNVS
jgi:hypothetical protein